MLFGWLRNVFLQLVCMVDGLRGWLFGWFDLMWHFNFHFKVSLPLTTSIGIYLLLNLVFTPEHLWTDSLPTWWHLSDRIYRQRLQMPLPTWIQGHQLRGKKRWVKKHFSFGENFYLTLPKLSFDESNCQSYSASHSFVCSSRCLNPLLSLLLSYPSVWLSGWLSSRLFFYPTHIRLLKINSPHMCWFFSQQ